MTEREQEQAGPDEPQADEETSAAEELSDDDLEEVAGGKNAQVDPPGPPPGYP